MDSLVTVACSAGENAAGKIRWREMTRDDGGLEAIIRSLRHKVIWLCYEDAVVRWLHLVSDNTTRVRAITRQLHCRSALLYKIVLKDHCDASFRTMLAQAHAWSMG